MDILSATYFEIFDVPVAFSYDEDAVRQRYRELQKALHPDNYVSSSAQEKRISMQHTARINEAYNVLKNPVDRALYMLSLRGVDINFETETTMDATFLMEQLEMREALEAVHQNDDPLAHLDDLGADVANRMSDLMVGFSDLYQADEFEQARELIRKMQFMQKARQEISESVARIEDEMLG